MDYKNIIFFKYLDYFVFTLCILNSTNAYAQPCEKETFLKKVCISNNSQHINTEDLENLSCNDPEQEEPYIKALSKMFEIAPSNLKDRLCLLDYVFVHPAPEGGSWFSGNRFSQKLNRNAKAIGFTPPTLKFSDLTAFGRGLLRASMRQKKIDPSELLPSEFGYDLNRPNIESAVVLYLAAHEIGHLIYNSAEFTAAFADSQEQPSIAFREGTFGAIDWVNGVYSVENESIFSSIYRGKIKLHLQSLYQFALPKLLPEIIKVSDLNSFFIDLFSSGFVTSFALASPEEDFCETYALQIMSNVVGSWNFKFLSGDSIDYFARFRNPSSTSLAEKISFIKRIEERFQQSLK